MAVISKNEVRYEARQKPEMPRDSNGERQKTRMTTIYSAPQRALHKFGRSHQLIQSSTSQILCSHVCVCVCKCVGYLQYPVELNGVSQPSNIRANGEQKNRIEPLTEKTTNQRKKTTHKYRSAITYEMVGRASLWSPAEVKASPEFISQVDCMLNSAIT